MTTQNDQFHLKQILIIWAAVLYGALAQARTHAHKKGARLCAQGLSHQYHPKRVLEVNMDSAPSASQIEPLQWAAKKRKSVIQLAHARKKLTHVYTKYEAEIDPNFGTAAENKNTDEQKATNNRTPASVDDQGIQLSARDLRRIQRSMRRKTRETLFDEYD